MLEYIESDFKKMMSSDPPTHLEDKHIVTLLYNSLCALHFIHSANVIHRDLKPANMLMDSQCRVKICDFGMARVHAKREIDRDFEIIQKTKYAKV